MSGEEQSIVPMPLIDVKSVKDIMASLDKIKSALMKKDKDYVVRKGKQYTTRSGFSKIALAFNLSDEVLEETEIRNPVSGEFEGWRFKVRVWQKASGRQAVGVGACTVKEPNMKHHMERPYHDCYATAHTRAWNRAISNIVGSSEVSAEEMGMDDPKYVESTQSPEPLTIPSWDFVESLRSGGWTKAVNITMTWMYDAGLQTEVFDIEADMMKVSVKPKDSVMFESGEWTEVDQVLKAAGFKWNGQSKRWRFNKPEE